MYPKSVAHFEKKLAKRSFLSCAEAVRYPLRVFFLYFVCFARSAALRCASTRLRGVTLRRRDDQAFCGLNRGLGAVVAVRALRLCMRLAATGLFYCEAS